MDEDELYYDPDDPREDDLDEPCVLDEKVAGFYEKLCRLNGGYRISVVITGKQVTSDICSEWLQFLVQNWNRFKEADPTAVLSVDIQRLTEEEVKEKNNE
jgi:hypothetical protein